MQRETLITLSFLLVSSVAGAQDVARGAGRAGAPGVPRGPVTLASDHQAYWARLKGYINNTARDMAEDMSYKPGYNQRTFGEVWGHMADARFEFCAAARGVPNPNKVNLQQTVKTKADALKAIADSEAFCDPAFASLTDASFVEVITPAAGIEGTGTAPIPRGSILTDLLEHDSIQYGYGVVYLRAVVPFPEGRGRGPGGPGRQGGPQGPPQPAVERGN
jgi:hypothetical protein